MTFARYFLRYRHESRPVRSQPHSASACATPGGSKRSFLAASFAFAVASSPFVPANAESAPDAASSTERAAQPGRWQRPELLGDLGGLRPLLGNYGVTLGIQETSEAFGNSSGGLKRGLSYDGVTQFGLDVDTEKALGVKGGRFFVDALQIHGRGISSRLGTLQSVSGVEADATTRLWELWYQQAFGDKFDLRIGQQSVDQEFIVSQYAATFANATFGWPALPSVDLPSGGPAFPLSSLGVRFRLKPTHSLTVLGGIFDGNPARGEGDPQKLNGSGTTFNLHDGAFLIGEVQYAINQEPAEGAAGPRPSGLPGTYKLGFWYQNQRFADPHYGTDGLSLASPVSNGILATHRGNYSIYAVADQMVWRASADTARSLGVFARAMGAPGNRNEINFGFDAGLVLKAPFRGRENDSVGVAVGYANISSSASAFDRDTATLSTPGYPVRSDETVVELTYQYHVAPWWMLQADFQYFFRPGGGIPNPTGGGRIGNESVVGLRTVLTF
jgi:porin